VTPGRRARAAGRWTAKRWIWLGGLLLVALFYLWTARSTSNPFAIGGEQGDYYNLLADAFRAGHLDLLARPPAELLALPNPYDPVANAPFRLHDASLYHGHYYLYWGPAPALLIFVPFGIIFGADAPLTLIVPLLATLGVAGSWGVLRALVRRFAPDAPGWAVALAAVALATGNAAPFLLARVAVYEASIAAAYAATWIGLWLLLKALERPEGERTRLLLLAGTTLGVGVLSRVTVLIAAVLAAWIAWRLLRAAATRAAPLRSRLREPVALLAPIVVAGLAHLLYNQLRFGSPGEFGASYMLAGYDPATKEFSRPEYVPPGLWYYLFSRAHLTAGFPFFFLPPPPASYPFALPRQWEGLEEVGGLINLPIVFALLAAPLALRGHADRRVLRAALAAALLGGAGLLMLVTFTIPGATMRYVVDFATFFLLPALAVWLVLLRRWEGWRRRAVAVAGGAAIAWGALFGVAVSFTGYYELPKINKPESFRNLRSVTSFVPTVVSRLAGHPMVVDVASPLGLIEDGDAGPGFGGPIGFDVGVGPVTLYVASGTPRRAGLVASSIGRAAPDARYRLLVEQPDTNRRFSIDPVGGPATIPLALRRGLNRIVLRVQYPGPVPANARLVAIRGAVVRAL
jgi:hypothetical protein